MQTSADLSLAEQFAAAQAWWREAGVEHVFTDEAEAQVKPEPEKPEPPLRAAPEPEKPATPPPPQFSRADLPQELDAFNAWWRNPETDLPHGDRARIAPRGVAKAKLMLVVPMPEQGDSNTLLAGQQGALLANIARALQIAEADCYFASALPAHVTLPDWDALGRTGLGEVLAHHIALAAPERVLLFGSRLPLLLGQEPDASPDTLSAITGTSTLATFAPERLLDHPRQRARLWRRLLDWTAA